MLIFYQYACDSNISVALNHYGWYTMVFSSMIFQKEGQLAEIKQARPSSSLAKFNSS